ncbi:MAG: outer membrane protein assembly factor [Bacteroidia bacterium]|nr:outer membrane protein assembly factor [Bacteroidia bacterium]
MRPWLFVVAISWAQDSLWIDPRRKLRPYDLERKRERWVWTAYPGVGYDPLRGFGAAIAASISYNGLRSDPNFAYAPYKYYLFVQAGGFVRESRYLRLFYDMPWIAGRPYRFTARLNYREESQGQFWGVGERHIGERLAEKQLNQYEKRLRTLSLSPEGIWETSLAQHNFYIRQWQGWFSGERVVCRGLVRFIVGLRWTSELLSSLNGRLYWLPSPGGDKVSARQRPTLIDSAALGLIPSVQGLQIGLRRWQHRLFGGGAVVLDTRDFELNPTKGWLMEVSHESRFFPFSTHKTTLSIRSYHFWYETALQNFLLSGAFHFLFTMTYGSNLPLTELYIHTRWADGRLPNLLSGPSTLRAFRENRFVSPVAYLLQYELRSRVAEVRVLKQHFTGGPVAFVDIASGRDKLGTPLPVFTVMGVGIGARILWNMNTIMRADFAYGREGWQLNFTTNHPF